MTANHDGYEQAMADVLSVFEAASKFPTTLSSHDPIGAIRIAITTLRDSNLKCAKDRPSVPTLRKRLIAFHQLFDQPILSTPSVPPDERVRLRAALIAEEFFETLESMFDTWPYGTTLQTDREQVMRFIRKAPIKVDMPELADGLADLDYVIEGTRLEFGIDGEPVGAEVHRTNMAKIGGPKDPVTGKVLKPVGWTPPDIEGVLKAQGWTGSPIPKAVIPRCSRCDGLMATDEFEGCTLVSCLVLP